ncbi:RT0821/Lpp0805 family surface protein [Arenibaculum sp.]|jgi:surface antigen|uniref:RT0821/Lpp0805 family surface protein n=1 Tax=Arenibaculum sp. TaxID=2865862 RepID=UPI002E0F6ADB|nr:RT0821/Lpp0805 family surface protein [Arenibaculum sp.]
MPIRKIAICSALALSLGACAQDGTGGIDSGTIGTIGGAAGGALLGSQIGSGTGQLAATAAGTLIGALAGREIAGRLAPAEQRQAVAAERTALTRNEEIAWSNPESGRRGVIEPVRTYEQNGRLCREYVHTVYIGGQAEMARGTACQQPDGTWQIVA